VRARLFAAALALAGGGCSHTRIATTERDARIYVDGRFAGKGSAEIRQFGPPGTARVLVKTSDGRRARSEIRRRFGVGTFLLGFVSYGGCWVLCWTYPGSLDVPLPEARASGWDPSPEDPWLREPGAEMSRPQQPAGSAPAAEPPRVKSGALSAPSW
jgi:hypothetical protein